MKEETDTAVELKT